MRLPALTEPDIETALASLGGWCRDDIVISKAFHCASFADAITFVVRIGFIAERIDHHPDIDIRYRTVTIVLTTHDAGGLTQYDMDVAALIDAAFAS